MNEPSYRLVFDATQKYGDRVPLAVGFGVAVAGACVLGALFVAHAVRRGHHRRVVTALAVLLITAVLLAAVGGSVAVIVSVAASSPSLRDTARAIDASPIVEGPVERFHPMPKGEHDSERFDVGGVHFEYGHSGLTQGFNQDVTVGGPMREGLYVRIHYVRVGDPPVNTIVRLEVRE